MSQSVVSKVLRQETSRREATREKGAVCFEFERDGEETRVRVARDIDPREFSDAITTSEPDAREFSDALPEYPLPGSGELGDDCGERFHGVYCPDCFKPHEVGRTCRNPDCPRCWQSWAFHQGVEMGAKLHKLSKHVNEQVFKHHLTVSLRDSTRFNSEDPMKQAREVTKVLLDKVGVRTGYSIYHPYRIAPEYRGEVLGHESGDGNMTWKDILEKIEGDEWTWESVREEFLIYGPHFHVVCLSGFVDTTGVGAIEDETGAVIHRITTEREDGKKKSIADVEGMCKVLAYSLSHTAIQPVSEQETHRTMVRPFGQVANFPVDKKDPSRQEVKGAMRSVAQTVLGVDFGSSMCGEEVPADSDHDHGHGHDHLTAARHLTGECSGSGFGSGEFDGFASDSVESGAKSGENSAGGTTAGTVPSSVSATTGAGTEPCTATLAPIWKAESDLGNLAKVNRVEDRHGEERLHELRKAVEGWRDMGSPRPPEVDPPDE